MPRLSLRRSLLLGALAGLAAVPLASNASPERGKPASAKCEAKAKIDPVRAALFARCAAGSDEIANLAEPDIGNDRQRAAATAFDRGCRAGTRATLQRHAVCYAAILPSGRENTTDE